MISITYRDLNNPDFISGMKRLGACSSYESYKTAYAVAKLIQIVEAELKTMGQLKQEMLNRCSPKETTITAQEFQAETEKFLAVEVDLDRPKLPLQAVFPAKLSAIELAALLPILEEPKET